MAILGAGLGTGFPAVMDTAQTYVDITNPDPDDNTRADAAFANDVLAAIVAVENGVGRLGYANTWDASQTVRGESSSLYFHALIYGTGIYPSVLFSRARGTIAAPTAVQLNDILGAISYRGHDGSSGFYTRAYALGYASENWTASAMGAHLTFQTTAPGGTTTSEKLRLDGYGNLLLNTTAPGTNAQGVLAIGNAAVVPASSPANIIQLYAKDSSAGSANSTVAVRTEQAVEAIGTFTPSHKLRIWINEVEYHIQLDAV